MDNDQINAAYSKPDLSAVRFGDFFWHSAIGMAIVSKSGQWLEVNHAIEKMLGYNREELFTKTFHDVTHSADLPLDMNLFDQCLQTQNDSYQTQKRYLHKDGRTIWAKLTVSAVRRANGQIDYFICQIVDISETKNLVAELVERNDLLKSFSHLVGHDLRSRASGIIMACEAVDIDDHSSFSQWVDMVKESGQSIIETLEQLMGLLNTSTIGHPDPTHLRPAIQLVIKQVSRQYPGCRVKVNLDLAEELVPYPLSYLHSLLTNLISNAFKYAKNDGDLMIRFHSFKDNDGAIHFLMEDNGIGFDMDEVGDDIFNLHQTFHEGYDSKGIGLFVTRRQLERYGAQIKAFSEVMKGSRFEIIFPV